MSWGAALRRPLPAALQPSMCFHYQFSPCLGQLPGQRPGQCMPSLSVQLAPSSCHDSRSVVLRRTSTKGSSAVVAPDSPGINAVSHQLCRRLRYGHCPKPALGSRPPLYLRCRPSSQRIRHPIPNPLILPASLLLSCMANCLRRRRSSARGSGEISRILIFLRHSGVMCGVAQAPPKGPKASSLLACPASWRCELGVPDRTCTRVLCLLRAVLVRRDAARGLRGSAVRLCL